MRILITGGAGFIGSNLANYFANKGQEVTLFDNLSRKGVEHNLQWLSAIHNDLSFVRGDVRDFDAVSSVVANKDVVIHLAAQTAVTTSVAQPRYDMQVNIEGTFNVLEAVRELPPQNRPQVLLTSTNKVYGAMEEISVVEQNRRFVYANLSKGVDESQILDFHSPYGCSKGAADQYVRDYARIYDLNTVVFRMSCIYGTRQLGTEDQGWVAHFLISALLGKPVKIYGNGKQVRDILFVQDLVAAFESAIESADKVAGQVFNIGGGPENSISLLELMDWIEKNTACSLAYSFADWRPGDQPIYISDISKAQQILGWQPEVPVKLGLEQLWRWIEDNVSLFSQVRV